MIYPPTSKHYNSIETVTVSRSSREIINEDAPKRRRPAVFEKPESLLNIAYIHYVVIGPYGALGVSEMLSENVVSRVTRIIDEYWITHAVAYHYLI